MHHQLTHQLLILMLSVTGIRTENSALFLAGSSSKCCNVLTSTLTAKVNLECAVQCTVDDACKSFSFNDSVCVVSNSPDCAASDAAMVFRKQVNSSGLNAVPAYSGYEQQIGDRRFWVFQQRKSGAGNFSRSWTEYERGFGDSINFWSGLHSINSATKNGNATLRIEMTTLNGTHYLTEWSNFTVGDACTNYTMQYNEYLNASSNVSDCLAVHKDMPFSTFDRDNDKFPGSLSKTTGNSGFWFSNVFRMALNAMYSTVERRSSSYMSIQCIFPGIPYSTLQETQMMLQL